MLWARLNEPTDQLQCNSTVTQVRQGCPFILVHPSPQCVSCLGPSYGSYCCQQIHPEYWVSLGLLAQAHSWSVFWIQRSMTAQSWLLPHTDSLMFGFLDPSLVLWGCHCIPAFTDWKTSDLLPVMHSAARSPNEHEDWVAFYIMMYVFLLLLYQLYIQDRKSVV